MSKFKTITHNSKLSLTANSYPSLAPRSGAGKLKAILAVDPGYGRCGWAVLAKQGKSEILNSKSETNLNFPNSKEKREILRSAQNDKKEKSQITNLKSQITLLGCDCIETDAKKSLPDRLKEIYDAIEYIIKKYQPEELAIEELFFFKNQKTVMQVSQARGVIIAAAKNHNLEVYEYTPLQVKSAIVGYGRGEKAQVQKMIKLHLQGQEMPIQDDAADAVAIALTHILHAKSREITLKLHANIQHTKAHENSLNQHTKTEAISNSNLVYQELSYQTVGALYDTYKELGPGLPEKYYYRYIKTNLIKRNLQVQDQLKVEIQGLPVKLGRFYIDFVVDDKIVVEIKTGNRFLKKDIDQIMNYLRHSGLKLGILARFSQNGVITRRLLLGREHAKTHENSLNQHTKKISSAIFEKI